MAISPPEEIRVEGPLYPRAGLLQRSVRPTTARHGPVRGFITTCLLLFFGAQIAAALVFVFWRWDQTGTTVDIFDKRFGAIKDMLALTLAPTVSLLGSAIGFYFGERSARSRRASPPAGTSWHTAERSGWHSNVDHGANPAKIAR